jgi:hypothetical protein
LKDRKKVNAEETSVNSGELEGKEQKPPVKPIKPPSTPRKRKVITPMTVYDELIKFCEKSDISFAKTILNYCTDKKKHQRSTVLYTIELLMVLWI